MTTPSEFRTVTAPDLAQLAQQYKRDGVIRVPGLAQLRAAYTPASA